MRQTRIGELLSQQINLSNHDVQEILAEQVSTHQKFGQIALQWGLCQPEDLWRAWFDQLGTRSPKVSLAKIGVDSRVITFVSKQFAEQYCVMPMRMFENQLLLAIDRTPSAELVEELGKLLGRVVKFVIADTNEIRDAQNHYYTVAA
ncbi:hypothetical protein BH10PLA1_BH10PLA1_18920 [soil metagenome]